MTAHDQPKYACPSCGATEYCTQPDSYAIYEAVDESIVFQKTEFVDDGLRLSCRECGEEPPKEFMDATS